MSNIISENIAGVINGVNKDFTFSSTPNTILNIFVDGSEVFATDYSVLGNVITMTTAPLYSIRGVYIVGTGQALNNTEILIPNETPVGIINGVNKTYTATNVISSILSVVKDGVETTDYTIYGNNIVFTQAPLYNVLMDYITSFEGADSSDLAGNTSQDKIINRIYNDIIKVNINSTVYKLDTTKELINEVQSSLLSGDYIGIDGTRNRETKFSFLYKKQYLRVERNESSVLTNCNVGENITIGDSNFSSGYILVNGDVIKYTTNTNGTLSGISGMSRNIKQGTKVYEIFKLDVNNFKTIDVNVDFGTTGYKLLYRDENNRSTKTGFTIVNDYYNNKYIQFMNIDSGDITITYLRKIPDITPTVNSIIPGDYAIKILPYLVSAIHLNLSDDYEKAVAIERIGLRAYQQLKLNYCKDFTEMNDTIENEEQPYYY